jgi:hypothetical protein
MRGYFSRFFLAFAALMLIAPQIASAKAVSKEGFEFPAQGDVKIVVFRPDVHVGSLKVGGVDEPNPDWTEAARKNIQTAMQNSAQAQGAKMTFLDDFEGSDADLVQDYRGLFQAVSSAIFQHEMFPGNRLPTKQLNRGQKGKKQYAFDWTLGPETARLKQVTGGDYGLFFYTYDSYGDAGRKVAQVAMAVLFGAWVPAGVHIGYAGLVDLNTGEIVWFNTDLAMGGDIRDPDGAVKRVDQLLKDFPLRDGAVPVKAAAQKN